MSDESSRPPSSSSFPAPRSREERESDAPRPPEWPAARVARRPSEANERRGSSRPPSSRPSATLNATPYGTPLPRTPRALYAGVGVGVLLLLGAAFWLGARAVDAATRPFDLPQPPPRDEPVDPTPALAATALAPSTSASATPAVSDWVMLEGRRYMIEAWLAPDAQPSVELGRAGKAFLDGVERHDCSAARVAFDELAKLFATDQTPAVRTALSSIADDLAFVCRP